MLSNSRTRDGGDDPAGLLFPTIGNSRLGSCVLCNTGGVVPKKLQMLFLGIMLAAQAATTAGPSSTAAPTPDPAAEKGNPIRLLQAPRVGPRPLVHMFPIQKHHSQAATLEETIDQCVMDEMAAVGTPGASVAVALDGQLIYQRGYGTKHRTQGGAVDADTYFRIGSVTQQLTAAAVMKQVDRGLVFLDDPVTRYVPGFEIGGYIPASRISIHNLLTHSSGFPDLYFDPNGSTDDEALGQWAAEQDDVVLHAPPGVFFNYSNPNFNLAGLVVERASGTPYREYMHQQVFGPAEMNRTTFDPEVVMADGNYTFGHFPYPGGTELIYAPNDYDNAVYAPAAYAFSTAGDLVHWAVTLMNGGGEVLTPASSSAMQTPQMNLDLLPGQGYGYGIFTEPFGDLEILQHGGNIWGWGAYLIWESDRQFAVAVLANSNESLPGAAFCIADAVLQPGPGPDVEDPADPSEWVRYEGEWVLSYRENIVLGGDIIVVDDDELMLLIWDTGSPFNEFFTLTHVGFNIFLADLDLDGEPESVFTFLDSGHPERPKWLRNRILVGSPRRPPLDPSHRLP